MRTGKYETAVMAGLMITFAVTAARGADPPATKPADAESTLLPIPKELQKDIPPPRTQAEVSKLTGKAEKIEKLKPLHIVLVAGPKDHGPGEHDYPAWQKAWQKLLAKAPGVKVTTSWEKPSADDLKTADALIFFKHFAWPKEQNEAIEAFLARGGGMMFLHWAVDCGDNAENVGKNMGPYWGPGAKFRHGWLDLEFKEGKDEALLRGFAGTKVRFHDESYWRLTGEPASVKILATATEDDGDNKMIPVPLVWNKQVGKGRIHVNILGHYNWTFNDPVFRVLALRGIAWVAGEPIDRFNNLVTVDVNLKD